MAAPSIASARSLQAVTQAGIAWPGRNFSFTRWRAMLAQTSGFMDPQPNPVSLPYAPRIIDNAVPHAPAPMIAISLMRASLPTRLSVPLRVAERWCDA